MKSNSRRKNVFPSVDPSGDPRSVPSYVSSLNPYIAPSEEQVGSLQEERRTKLEQVKALENTIASGKKKIHKDACL